MPMQTQYTPEAIDRTALDRLPGVTLVEFGTNWCGHCQAAQPLLAGVMEDYPGMRHLKVEDGQGKPLGRSFRVKLWPTLIFLRDGLEVSRLVRPTQAGLLEEAFEQVVREG